MKMTGENKASAASKKVLFFLLAVLFCGNFFPSRAWAVKEYTIESIPNVRLSNRLNHVSNPDGIIQPEDVIRMNQLLTVVEDSLGIEVAVVAVESIGDNSPRMFATDLFKHWGLGKKGTDNGLLIQLVTDPSQRSVVFETGYGLEGVLPDAICYRLQQRYMIPDLKEGNYSAGMLKGVAAVKHFLMTSDYERAAMTGRRQLPANNGTDSLSLWLFSAMSVLFLGVIVFAGYLKRRPRICPRCGKKSFVYRGRQTIMSPTYYSEGVEEDIFRCSNCGYEHRNRHTIDRLHRGGGGPIIFGGGGMGGFSGGSSGGSWGGGSSGGGGAESRF